MPDKQDSYTCHTVTHVWKRRTVPCIPSHTHTHTHTHTHVYTHKHVCTHTDPTTHTCICTQTCTHTHTHTHTCIIYTQTCTHTHRPRHKHVHADSTAPSLREQVADGTDLLSVTSPSPFLVPLPGFCKTTLNPSFIVNREHLTHQL